MRPQVTHCAINIHVTELGVISRSNAVPNPTNRLSLEVMSKPSTKTDSQMTPMMRQFFEIKEANPGYLLFFRMGDFYELFFEDAERAAQALNIALTKRGKHLGEDIPMCGVPVHAAESYLQRLIQQDFRVAICEQTEDPAEAKKRGAKSVVKREVIRLVTPGTITEDALLNTRANNYLACLHAVPHRNEIALSWYDMSTGEFRVESATPDNLEATLAKVAPRELLVAEKTHSDPQLEDKLRGLEDIVTILPDANFRSSGAEDRLASTFNVKTIDAFGDFTRAERTAASVLVDYVQLTQMGQNPVINPLSRVTPDKVMVIDAATQANLELVKTLSGEHSGSLAHHMDLTLTGAGSRLLKRWLVAPLANLDQIEERLDSVEFCQADEAFADRCRSLLKACPDVSRPLSRLSLRRGGPRDLAALRDGLATAEELKASIVERQEGLIPTPKMVAELAESLGSFSPLIDALTKALSDELPLLAREGGFVAPGFDPDLDRTRQLREDSRRLIASLQSELQTQTGLKNLKIKHNNMLGYFVEVPARQAQDLMKPPMSDQFIHRQTMANAVRFTTAELGELDREIAQASDRALQLETQIFDTLSHQAIERAADISRTAEALAHFDLLAALARLASERNYVRPLLTNDKSLRIKRGRHPVVEAASTALDDEPFVANSCDLSEPDHRVWLVTGPNMAGKSTFLRQNALIAIMAQMGSFVPAERAELGIVDRLYSRVGAADDLARGRSTFMVEMVETAAILNQATPRSLVILDEVGRGTATFDGLSIAWAALEHLHDTNACRTLFATHFHELTALAQKLKHVKNVTIRVKEWQGDLVFLHEIADGMADRSYGIQVARLAGLPRSVTDRAQQILTALEKNRDTSGTLAVIDDLPLFAPLTEDNESPAAAKDPVIEMLNEVDPDQLTPRQALDVLYALKDQHSR